MRDSLADVRRVVEEIWGDVLRLEEVSPDDNFFVLGGESMAAAAIVSRVRERLGVDIRLRDLFETGTWAKLADRAEKACPLDPIGVRRLRRVDRTRPLLASVTQEWQFLLGEDSGQDHATPFLIHVGIRIGGPLDVPRLRRALELVSERHELLRTGFYREGEHIYQRIMPHALFPLKEVRIDSGETNPFAAAVKLAEEEAAGRFDRSIAPLARCSLFELGVSDHLLFVVIDHIICDGVSLSVLMEDLGVAYAALEESPGYRLPELEHQFADWAQWQRDRLGGHELAQMESYWRDRLGPDPRIATTPFEGYTTPLVERAEGVKTFLDEETTAVLRASAHRHGVTLYALMLGGFLTRLSTRMGRTEICVVTTLANREPPGVERIFGPFAHDAYIRVEVAQGQDVGSVSTSVQRATEEAARYGLIPNTMLWEMIWPGATPKLLSAPSFYFSVNRHWLAGFRFPGLTLEYVEPVPQMPMPGLECTVVDMESHLIVEVGYLTGSLPERYALSLVDEVVASLLCSTGVGE